MIVRQGRRWVAGGLLVPFLAVAGCGSGWKQLEQEELVAPEPARSYRVTTEDGRLLTFIDLHLEGESLVGTVRETRTETVGEGESQRSNVTNRYEEVRLPWNTVKRVEAERKGQPVSGVVLAAGAIGVGVAAFLLLSGNGDTTPDGGGGGKDF
jgi:hypothetical protein